MPVLLHTPAELRAALQPYRATSRIGFVPTMGYLHEGHATLLRQARAENDVVVLSIFVNPLQFGPHEDLERYPRDQARDLKLAAQEGVDFVFHPDVATMYPPNFSTRVNLTGVSEPFDGAARPGHFSGVATVVTKLFHIVQPTSAYFGEKDWQQLAVIRRMVKDLDINIEIVGVPIVRDPLYKGLAQSSRNSYLTDEQKQLATRIYKSLQAIQKEYNLGERNAQNLIEKGLSYIKDIFEIDYLSLVDSELNELKVVPDPDEVGECRILVAVQLKNIRLIDNAPLV